VQFLPSRRLVLSAGLAAALPLRASADDRRITSSVLLEDARVFQRAYESLHPGLLRYATAGEMAERFAALRAFLSQPRTLGETHLAFARFAASVRCGHSFLNPTNQTGAASSLISGGRTRLPFHFRWIDGRMIVDGSPTSDPVLKPGTEILSIGSIPCTALLLDLLPLAHADGHNEAARIRQMEIRGDPEWNAFDIYLPMLHSNMLADGFAKLTTKQPTSGRDQSLQVSLITQSERAGAAGAGVGPSTGSDPIWQIEHLARGGAWLPMPSWAVFDSKSDWRGALNTIMDDLAADGCRTLVVDLRGNAGGLNVGDVILSRLIQRDRAKIEYRRQVRYRSTPSDLNPYLKTWDASFRDWGAQAVGPDSDGFYSLDRASDAGQVDTIRPYGRRFTGRLIAIVDASNSSATFGFAQTVKTLGLGTLVGQPTGGSRRGINGGAFFFLRLPGSGLEIDIPLIGYFPVSSQPDEGIKPDIAVTVAASDLTHGIDAERNAALRLATAL